MVGGTIDPSLNGLLLNWYDGARLIMSESIVIGFGFRKPNRDNFLWRTANFLLNRAKNLLGSFNTGACRRTDVQPELTGIHGCSLRKMNFTSTAQAFG